MRIVYRADSLMCGTSIPEYFVTTIGEIRLLRSGDVALTLCRDEACCLLPMARMIWPMASVVAVNPDLAKKCMGKWLC
jgi:hypothetical protein